MKNLKKAVMQRAWYIYKKLVGDRDAKLKMALRQAWKEAKEEFAGYVSRDGGYMSGYKLITKEEVFEKIAYRLETYTQSERDGDTVSAYCEQYKKVLTDMDESSASSYVYARRHELQLERNKMLQRHQKDEIFRDLGNRMSAWHMAHSEIFDSNRRKGLSFGIYDTVGNNFGTIIL